MTTENTAHLPMIAKELSDMGFEVRTGTDNVKVSLSRPVFESEVRMALEQAFEGIEFKLNRFGGCVYVQA